jgi:rhodanese-related sulfurtransferase
MKQAVRIITVSALLLLPSLLFAGEARPTMAPLCAGCHQPEPGVLMGTLDNISYKADTLQLDLVSHKEIIRFDEKTKVKNVASLEELKTYKNRAFTVNFVMKKGEKLATVITRFDVLKALKPEEKIDKAGLKKLMAEKKNLVIVDARPVPRYEEGHIPGAIVMPAAAFDKLVDKLPKDKTTPLVFYCVGGCSSPLSGVKAKSLGYTDVKVYVGGMPDWVKSEYTTVTPSYLKGALAQRTPLVLVDTRARQVAEQGHIPGALSLDLEKSRSSLPRQKNAPIIFYGDRSAEAAAVVVAWGYTGVKTLPLTFAQWQAAGNPVAIGALGTIIAYVPKPKPGTVSPEEFTKFGKMIPADTDVIDVRYGDEYAAGHVQGAKNFPLEDMAEHAEEITKARKLVLYCDTGMRAEMAYNILKDKGYATVRFLDGTLKFQKDGSFGIITE